MCIWKRIAKLELAEKQRSCEHSFESVNSRSISQGGVAIEVTAKCWKCDKQLSQTTADPKILSAHNALFGFLRVQK